MTYFRENVKMKQSKMEKMLEKMEEGAFFFIFVSSK